MWRRQRLLIVVLIIIGLAGSIATLALPTFRKNPNPFSWVWFVYPPAGIVIGGIFLYYRWRSYVAALEEGLKVSSLFSSVVIDYGYIRFARVQPLDRHFQDARKKLIRPQARALLPKPALYVKLKGEEQYMLYWRKKLGSQLMADDTIALPIPDPDAMSWEISSRLPDKAGVNLGGRRRGKRGR